MKTGASPTVLVAAWRSGTRRRVSQPSQGGSQAPVSRGPHEPFPRHNPRPCRRRQWVSIHHSRTIPAPCNAAPRPCPVSEVGSPRVTNRGRVGDSGDRPRWSITREGRHQREVSPQPKAPCRRPRIAQLTPAEPQDSRIQPRQGVEKPPVTRPSRPGVIQRPSRLPIGNPFPVAARIPNTPLSRNSDA